MHKSPEGQSFPFPRTDLSQGFCDGDAECREAVRNGNAEVKLGDLTVELARGEALAQELDAVHLGLGATSAVLPAPSSPDGSTDTLRCAQDLVAGDRPGGVGLPGFGILARWDDRCGTAGSDGIMALAGVESAVGGDGGNFLLGWDLIEQFRQHGGIPHVTGGELGSSNFQCFLINSDEDLAPDPAFGAAMLAGVPLPFALDLDAGAVDQQVQRAVRAAVGDIDLQRLLATGCRSRARPSPRRSGAIGSRQTRSSAAAPCGTAPSSSGRSGWRHRCSRVGDRACRSALPPKSLWGRTSLTAIAVNRLPANGSSASPGA